MQRFKLVILIVILLMPFSAHAIRFKALMDEWLGATKETVKSKWGYPDSVDSVENATVYYYISYKRGLGGPRKCVVRFYIVSDVVDAYKYRGAHCPKYRRPKEDIARAKSGNSNTEKLSTAPFSQGTGWVVSGGYIVTNAHVVEGKEDITIVYGKKKQQTAKIAIVDKVNDIVLLKSKNPSHLPPAIPISPKQAPIGASVFAIGFPLTQIMGIEPKLTTGIVSSITGYQDDPRLYQISVPTQSGNSGSALVNMRGEVVGIVTSKLRAVEVFLWSGDIPQNVNYAMKAQYLKILLSNVKPLRKSKILTRKKASLEILAKRIKNSTVVIVAR